MRSTTRSSTGPGRPSGRRPRTGPSPLSLDSHGTREWLTRTRTQMPTCSCPDGIKNGTCKHILFVMLKVLAVPVESNLCASPSSASRTSLVADRTRTPQGTNARSSFPSSPTSSLPRLPTRPPSSPRPPSAPPTARPRPARRPSMTPSATRRASEVYPRRRCPRRRTVSPSVYHLAARPLTPRDGPADCPVCYDSVLASDLTLTFCLVGGGCGRPLHGECLDMWKQTQKRAGKGVTCASHI